MILRVTRFARAISSSTEQDQGKEESDDEGQAFNFRDLLKARTIHLKRPLQLMWPSTWEDPGKVVRKLEKFSGRRVQDPASRAWNLFNALYYKAGYVPWQLPRDPSQFQVSHVGISFYRDLSGQQLLTSTAQMFDERGQGLILRGGRAKTDKHDRHPYLSREDAYDLLRRSLQAYAAHHFHPPARVVIYKTSRFEPEEVAGFDEALNEERVRLFRLGLSQRADAVSPLSRWRLSAIARDLSRARKGSGTLHAQQRSLFSDLSRALRAPAYYAPPLPA